MDKFMKILAISAAVLAGLGAASSLNAQSPGDPGQQDTMMHEEMMGQGGMMGMMGMMNMMTQMNEMMSACTKMMQAMTPNEEKPDQTMEPEKSG